MVRIPTHRAPTHPGEILLEEYLGPLGMTQVELAERLEVPLNRVNEIIKGKRGVTLAERPACVRLIRHRPLAGSEAD